MGHDAIQDAEWLGDDCEVDYYPDEQCLAEVIPQHAMED